MISRGEQERLPDERRSLTHKVKIVTGGKASVPVLIRCGTYHDGRIGEVQLAGGKEGCTLHGMLNAISYTMSLALQFGAPLPLLVEKMRFTSFDPRGTIRGIPRGLYEKTRKLHYPSILDYLGAYLEWRFPDGRIRDDEEAEVENA